MTTLYYVHDPMCSWCWGFSRSWQQLRQALPAHIKVVRLLGGLAADSDEPMDEDMQHSIAETWRRIENHIPGVRFNFAFWNENVPRRSTWPACRAVIAARHQGAHYDSAMTAAIQRAYYQQARNPSDAATLIALASELGLDSENFCVDLHDPTTQSELDTEMQQAHAMHADSFPSLVLEQNGGYWPIAIDYNDYHPMLEMIQQLVADESAG